MNGMKKGAMMRSLQMAIAMVMAAVAMASASADSLWSDASKSLVTDTKAHGVGDLLTVVILQDSSSSTQAKHTTNKTVGANADPGGGMLAGLTGIGAKADRTTNGAGASTASTRFLDRLTVTVVEVLPNGNLRIEGTRAITLEKDQMMLVFRGLVRPADIGADNTVSSILVAEQQLEAKGNGPIAEKQRPGLFSRLLALFW